MLKSLNNLIISFGSVDYKNRISDLHKAVKDANYFKPGDDNHNKLIEILNTVKVRKNAAIIEYTERFDNVKLSQDNLKVSLDELKQAHEKIEPELLNSLKRSIANVRRYQEEIFTGKDKQCSGGCGVKYMPISRAGLCIPGAAAPLASTVIMTAVPAQVAGVKELVLVSPPRFNGDIHPVILGLSYELGIKEVYRIGGAHAVAALAYGTETVKPVEMIVGPGNAWVQMAKKELYGQVKIDSIAGPSEVLIIANDSAKPEFIASDMLSQAEHGTDSSALLFTDSQKLADDVLAELKDQVQKLNRSKKAVDSLINSSGIIIFENMDSAIEQANNFAAEHLQIQCGNESVAVADKIINAGAIFIGSYTPVATGDYFAGPSHTLPTGSSAKFFNPLSSNDFVKSSSIIQYDKQSLTDSSEDIIRLAKTEGLDAHANSVKIRDQK